MHFVTAVMVLVCLGPAVSYAVPAAAVPPLDNSECPEGAEGISCLGSTIAKNMVQQVLGVAQHASSRQLWDGIELVRVANNQQDFSVNQDAEDQQGRDLSTSVLNHLRQFVSNYEIRVRLSELVSGVAKEFSEVQAGRKGGFGGGKKKDGGIMMLAMMMAGMMKAMALGALGLLAMKALTVSSLAFLLSAIVGLKKLVSKGGGDEGGHYVQVVGGHGGSGGGDYHGRSFVADATPSSIHASHDLAYRGQRK